MLTIAAARSFGQSSTAAQLTISAPKADFFLGEVIRLDLKFTALEPNRFLAGSRQSDRIGRLNFTEQFVVEPRDAAEDPLEGLFAAAGAMGGIFGPPVVLSSKPLTIPRVLNEYIRFRRPGQFRIRVISRRVTEVDPDTPLDGTRLLTARGKPVELVSNELTLSIQPAPAAWIAQQIASARATLAQPDSPSNEESAADRRRAIGVLRALDTVDSAMELARSPAADAAFAAHVAILGSPHRKELLPLLERLLVEPGHGVSSQYLDTLTQFAEMVAYGPMPAYPKDPEEQQQWQNEAKRRSDQRQRKQDEFIGRVIASLPSKQPAARAVTLHALLTLAMRSPQEPPWRHDIAATLMAEFRRLPDQIQTELLESYWPTIRSEALLPLLRELLESARLRNTALRRIYDLDPGEARQIILDEIRQPKHHFEFPQLAMLPDRSLPELDGVLAQRMDPLLILRYASGDIVKQVEGTYFARPEPRFCAGPLAFYFLKYDPPAGEKLLRAEFAKTGLPPACYDLGFQFLSLGRWAYSPALESLAIASLTSDKVPIKRGAAELLGKYGTAAAKKPLWDAMEYFRSWWKDREEQLNRNIGEESRQLELALRTALAKADTWVLSNADLHRLLDLCSSQWCRTDVSSWIRGSASPVSILPYRSPDGLQFTLESYGSGDVTWLTRKVAQFPEGVTFRIAVAPGTPDAAEIGARAVRAAGRIAVP